MTSGVNKSLHVFAFATAVSSCLTKIEAELWEVIEVTEFSIQKIGKLQITESAFLSSRYLLMTAFLFSK